MKHLRIRDYRILGLLPALALACGLVPALVRPADAADATPAAPAPAPAAAEPTAAPAAPEAAPVVTSPAPAPAAPATAPVAQPAPKPWTITAQVTYISTQGNTNQSTLGGSAMFTYKWTYSTLELGGGGMGVTSESITLTEQYNAYEKFLYKLTERNYAFEKVGWEKDRFAGITARVSGSAGLGREAIKTAMHNLIAELGGGYVDEQRTPPAKRVAYASGRAYGKYALTISKTSAFSQDGEYLHDFEDEKNYRINAESALISALSSFLSLKVSYLVKHVHEPVEGFRRNDTVTTAALIANY